MKDKLATSAEVIKLIYAISISAGAVFYAGYLISIRFIPEGVSIGDLPLLILGALGFFFLIFLYLAISYTFFVGPSKLILYILCRIFPGLLKILDRKVLDKRDVFASMISALIPIACLIILAFTSTTGEFSARFIKSVSIIFLSERIVNITISTFPSVFLFYFLTSLTNEKRHVITDKIRFFGLSSPAYLVVLIVISMYFFATGGAAFLITSTAKILGIREDSVSLVINESEFKIIRDVLSLDKAKIDYCVISDRKVILYNVDLIWKGLGTKYLLSVKKPDGEIRIDVSRDKISYISKIRAPSDCIKSLQP